MLFSMEFMDIPTNNSKQQCKEIYWVFVYVWDLGAFSGTKKKSS